MAKTKILLISPMLLPIPAVGGGAIETLITSLVDKNEEMNTFSFVVLSIYDSEAASHHYKNAKIIYLDNYHFVDNKGRKEKSFFLTIFRLLSIVAELLFANKFMSRVFRYRHFYPLRFFSFLCYRIAKREKVDLIIDEMGGVSPELALLPKRFGEDKSYLHIHFSKKVPNKWNHWFKNTISVSDFSKRLWLSSGFTEGRHFVLNNCIEKKYLPQLNTDEIAFEKRKLNINDNNFIFLYIGRISVEKGTKELINAFSMIKDDNIRLVVIGSVAFSIKTTSSYYEEVINLINMDKRIIYIGYVPNHELNRYYSVADVLVIPSICEEGGPLVPLEAITKGLPIICTKSGGLLDYLDDKCAFFVDKESNVEFNLSVAMTTIKDNKASLIEMRKAALERSQLFSTDKYFSDFTNIVKSIVK